MSKMQFIIRISAIIIAVQTNIVLASYSGGDGTEGNPYKISRVNDLLELMSKSGDWGKNFILTADLNFKTILNTLSPIGNSTTRFTGIFDGNNHIISNALINYSSSNYVGLFGDLGSSGQIRNLIIKDIRTNGNYEVGGLVGRNYHGTLINCSAASTVTAKGNLAGGLVGMNQGTITNCYSTGSVSGADHYVGGLVGENYGGTINSCYSTSSVNGAIDIGGLAGNNDEGTITACYSSGSVKGNYGVGGLVGLNWSGTITSCYATGFITGTDISVCGFVGGNYGNINGCFWDMETSGRITSDGGRGLTTTQMKSIAIFQNAGWTNKGWVMQDGLDYPRLSWENTQGLSIPEPLPVPLTGSGSAQNPYQIWTVDDFIQLSYYVGILDKNIILMRNLDLNDVTLYPIGDLGAFTGVFDGNDHIISNAIINQPSCTYVGLFSYLGSGGQIRNLGAVDVNIKGRYDVGGLVGSIKNGFVINCFARSSVSGDGSVGGLVGENKGGIITSCYATTSIIGDGGIGGLLGMNNGTLTSCYATGSVNGNEIVGGLVGYNHNKLTNCFSACSITGTESLGGLVGQNSSGTLTSCFWDKETSGMIDGIGSPKPDPSGVKGKTKAEMKTLFTFKQANWDFVNVWGIGEGQTYPYLRNHPAFDFDENERIDYLDLKIMAENWLSGVE